jgi:CRP-like cAMP-binding protein
MIIRKNYELVLKQLRECIERSVKIPDKEWDYALNFFSVKVFKKNSFLVKAGEKPDLLFSLIKGLVRFYYITESGKEYNKYFVMDNRFFSSFSSLFLNLPCGFYIQAFEETETLVISKNSLEVLYKRNSCWERYGRLIAISFIHHMEQREREFLLDPLEVRYAKFLQEYPDLINRIPQYHIATYLGVTDVALSRLRKKKKYS